MKMSLRDRTALRSRRRPRLGGCRFLLTVGSALAGPIPANLGAGLYDLVRTQSRRGPARRSALQQQQVVADEMMTISNDDMLRDDADRVLVNIVVDGRNSAMTQVRAAVSAVPRRLDHRRGLEVPCGHHRRLRAGRSCSSRWQRRRGVSAIHAVHRPTTNVGSVTQQGYRPAPRRSAPPQPRRYGITIGMHLRLVTTRRELRAPERTLTIHEAQDIASCDLPGTGNPCGNTQPVVVLEDFGTFPNTAATDEGAAMAQLIHDMVPKARLGFATAFEWRSPVCQ